jgi:hypothetical protein
MLERSKAILSAAAITAAAFSFAALTPLSQAQAPTLQEQLSAQYKVAKMGSDTSGYSVVDQGTLLAIQKGGILGVPYSDTNSVPPTKYENGQVHTPSGLLTKGIGFGMKKFGKDQTTKLFAQGNKVYPTKIEVNTVKDQVNFSIVSCDTCNNVDPPTYNKAVVIFQFPHGSLAKASAGEVEDTIGQLLAISNDDQNGGGDNNQGGGNDQGNNNGGGGNDGGDNAGGGNEGGGGQQQQAEPQTIEKGMTPDQVQNSLGKPDKIVNLGTKQLYIYKDMKVTFVNGKVTDVQ